MSIITNPETNQRPVRTESGPLKIVQMPTKPTTARWFCRCGQEHRVIIRYIGQEIKWTWPCPFPTKDEIDLITIGG